MLVCPEQERPIFLQHSRVRTVVTPGGAVKGEE